MSSSQRPLPDNTQHSQQTNIHALGVIRTHDLSRRTATDLSLRPRGFWDRLCLGLPEIIMFNLLMPNDDYSGRTAPLTSKCCILYIYSTNIGTVYFKHGIYSPGESNGKLPPRICPGCRVPEPYRSHDWALVPASTAFKAEY